MVPLVLAVLLSYCLSPVVELAERRAGLPHGYGPTAARPAAPTPHARAPRCAALRCRPGRVSAAAQRACASLTEALSLFVCSVAVMTALVVASSALLLLVFVVTLAAHDIVGKAKQYEAYVVALSNRAAAAHKSAAASLANSKLASKVMERSAGDFISDGLSEFSLGAPKTPKPSALVRC